MSREDDRRRAEAANRILDRTAEVMYGPKGMASRDDKENSGPKIRASFLSAEAFNKVSKVNTPPKMAGRSKQSGHTV